MLLSPLYGRFWQLRYKTVYVLFNNFLNIKVVSDFGYFKQSCDKLALGQIFALTHECFPRINPYKCLCRVKRYIHYIQKI